MAYTAEEVDKLAVDFEQKAEKQIANVGKPVRLRAAERDLLQVAEAARNLMLKAVKGDKALLSDVFGGSCERFHRFRRVLETVQMSDMHASDARWKDLKNAIDTIEEVLKQLGMFKPWSIQKKPSAPVYSGMKGRFAPGEEMMMMPEMSGGDASFFKIEPALPQGLEFEKSTGKISGAPTPGVEVPETTYKITASNDAGSSTSDITFAIAEPAPEKLSYPGMPSQCYTDEAVNFAPSLEGGCPSTFSVSPALPKGMSLDAHTGVISGTPIEKCDEKTYTITASNSSGKVEAEVPLAVILAPPSSLSYPGVQKEYPQGTVMYLKPNLVLSKLNPEKPATAGWRLLRAKMLHNSTRPIIPHMTYTIEPALPEGVFLVSKTGIITGKADAPADENTYKITAKNDSGEVSTQVTFAIKLLPPASLEYPNVAGNYYTGNPVAMSPKVDGTVSEWKIEPALPEGLFFDTSMGIIKGVPTAVSPEKEYTITAKNSEGETSVGVKFGISRAPPTELAYPDLAHDIPVLRSMEAQPVVQGEVDEYSVSPALPAGLQLDPKTGVISGTPTVPVEDKEYIVSAKNESGTTTVPLKFATKVIPPEALVYPQIDDVYTVGEKVSLEPSVVGGATSWVVEPALPAGLEMDPSTGKITGTPTAVTEEASYVVTASNEAGGTSTVLTFAVTCPPPGKVGYPNACGDFTVGQEVSMEPVVESGAACTFSVSPALPPGLSLDPNTGIISGSPTAVTDKAPYKVTASNASGTADTVLEFACSEAVSEETGIDQKFAAMIEEITELSEMVEEPNKTKNLGDWMIWMVHRAWLNDPTLIDFNFSNLYMPFPHVEPRIAPKLMAAMGTNTHITTLNLTHSNLQKPQGHELAESLKKNTAVKTLNVDSNSLDSEAIRAMASALKENEQSAIAVWRFNNQENIGDMLGRPVEQAVAEMMDKNTQIVKLGFSCQDPNWRMKVDRAILRNNDYARRRRKGSVSQEVELVAAKEKEISKVTLVNPPTKARWEVWEDDDTKSKLVCAQTSEAKRLPTKEQVQAYAKSKGAPLKYSDVAPLAKGFRCKLLDAVVQTQVVVVDKYEKETKGTLRGWTEKNERFSFDVLIDSSTRFNCTATKQPIIEIGDDFAAWLKPGED